MYLSRSHCQALVRHVVGVIQEESGTALYIWCVKYFSVVTRKNTFVSMAADGQQEIINHV